MFNTIVILQIVLDSFGKRFHMSLFPNFEIYHADFKIKVFKDENKFEYYEHFDKSRLYKVCLDANSIFLINHL